jgi:hypothetical protein
MRFWAWLKEAITGKRFWIWLPVSECKAYREGVHDGRRWKWRIGFPPWEAKEPFPELTRVELTPAEQGYCQAAEAMLNNLATEWMEKDSMLLESCKTAKKEYEEAIQKLGQLRPEEARAIKEYEAARSFYDSLQHPLLPQWFHVLFWLLILAGEFYFNQLVFNIFLQPRIDTMVMALSLVVAMVVAAEFVGRTLRRQRKGRGEVLWLVVIPAAFAFFVFLGLSYIREKYVEYAGAGALGFSLSPVALNAIFLVFNMSLFLANTVIAYHASPPDPDAFGKAKRKLKEAHRQVKRLEPQLKELSERLAWAHMKLEQAHVRRTREFGKFQEQANNVIKGTGVAVSAYRRGNMRARGGGATPKCFKIDPCENIKLPDRLQQLDQCDTCIYPALQAYDMTTIVTTLVSPHEEVSNQVRAHTPVPLVLSEVTNVDEAVGFFDAFVSAMSLPNSVGVSLSRNQLALCLSASAYSLRTSSSEQDWQRAWEQLVSAWEDVDNQVRKECSAGYVYHIFPHLVLPLAFAVGAAVDLRRPLVLYHQEQGRYFPVMDLQETRKLFQQPPDGSPALSEVREKMNGAQKLIVHFFITDRHIFRFENHPDHEAADNVAFLYLCTLPSNKDWLPYVQHLWQGYRSYVEKKNYEEIEVCVLGPAVVAFALGMAFSRESRVAVCQWFGSEFPPVYRRVFSLRTIEQRQCFS